MVFDLLRADIVMLQCTNGTAILAQLICYLGAFTNYVYKRRGVGGQKNQLFVNFYIIENVNGGG